MCSHVPNKGEQMVRYYGHYSNVNRGRRKKARTDDQTPYILEPELSPKEFRKNWARLIQKIYELDLLTCSKCQGSMRVIAFIEDEDVMKLPAACGGELHFICHFIISVARGGRTDTFSIYVFS